MVSRGYEVSEKIKEFGISSELINVRFLKPLDKQNILKSIQKNKNVYTLEDGSINGGLYTSIAELTANIKDVKLQGFAYNDEFIQHGTVTELEEINNLSVKSISEKIVKEIKNAKK